MSQVSMGMTMNNISWEEKDSTKAAQCIGCKVLTKGRSKRKAICMPCVIKQAMKLIVK